MEYRILEKSHHLKERLLLIHIITNDKTIQQNKVHVKINKIHIYIFPLFLNHKCFWNRNASRDVLGPLPICKNTEENLNMCPLFCLNVFTNILYDHKHTLLNNLSTYLLQDMHRRLRV